MENKTQEDIKHERIKKAINHRDKQIAYFNSVNSAISLLNGAPDTSKARVGGVEPLQEKIRFWREWFYQEWQNWYIETNELDQEDNIQPF